jgi:hypothetical protein
MVGCGETKKQNISPKDALQEKLNQVVSISEGTITEKSSSTHPKYGTEKETFTITFKKDGKNVWYEMQDTTTNAKGKQNNVAYKNEKGGYYVKNSGENKFTRLSDCNNASYDDVMEIFKMPLQKDANMNVSGSENQFSASQKDEKVNGKNTFTYTFTDSGVKVHVVQVSANGKIKLECDYEVKSK